MKTKFTKGNWIINPTEAKDDNGNPLYYDIVINSENGIQSFISTIKNPYLGISIDESLYNAKLISAAPDLLLLANQYLSYIKSMPMQYEEDFEFRDYVESVIKKATE